jgi:hypothetical protein
MPTVVNVRVPRFFKPRSYQQEFLDAMRAGCKRAALVWHRRAGKDETVLNWTIEAMVQKPGSYYYFFPTLKQGRKILWKGQGARRPFLDHFPPELLIGEPNETEMSVKLKCQGGGYSLFQILGANEIDRSAIGTNPIGTVWSEYSLQTPAAWQMMRPVLAENRGWAVFPYTPRGKNWGYDLWLEAKKDPSFWYSSLKTVEMTVRDGGDEERDRKGQPVVDQQTIQRERNAGYAEELIQQEYYCSFEGAIHGSYFGDAIERMEREGRVLRLPYNRDLLVDTSWDLGVDDETVIGFWQTVEDARTGQQYLHLIDVHAESRNPEGIAGYWRMLRNEKPYIYGQHDAPWDVKVQEWGSGNTRLQIAQSLGLNFEPGLKLGVAEGIAAVRRMLPIVYVDETRCAKWIEAMRTYRREFDEDRMTFLDKPVHDWSSHWADMTRYKAVATQYKEPNVRGQKLQERAETDFDLFAEPEQQTSGGLLDWSRHTNWGRFDARR